MGGDPSVALSPTSATEGVDAREEARIPRAMTIAGSDSGGGAGIQADLKTFAVLGVWGTSAITSVTIQNTMGVSGVADLPADVVAAQMRAVITDIGIDSAKTGMLSSAGIIDAVANTAADVGLPKLVVDPVFVSKHGHPLLRPDAVESLRRRILPLATLATPNVPEAAGLSRLDISGPGDMADAGRVLLGLGCGAVLIKGGHLEGVRSDDLYMDGDRMEWLRAERIEVAHTHGTGCVLSSAIAAYLARGEELLDAVRSGKEFVTQSIRHGLALGGGIGPVSPAWRLVERPHER